MDPLKRCRFRHGALLTLCKHMSDEFGGGRTLTWDVNGRWSQVNYVYLVGAATMEATDRSIRTLPRRNVAKSSRDARRSGIVLDPETHGVLREAIFSQISQDMTVLDDLREEIRELRGAVRQIQPRITTSLSLVGTDGGNNQIRFDPFLVQVVRVVDSNENEYCVEAISPTTDVRRLSAAQFEGGRASTPLGGMMEYLGVRDLTELSHMIRYNDDGQPTSSSWVQVYRELVEWAVLFHILRERQFASDTIIVFDGLLRSKAFAGELFADLRSGFRAEIERHRVEHRRNIYLAGVAKRSKVLDRYRLAMSLEGILQDRWPAYVEIPRDIEARAYTWSEYARGSDVAEEGGEANKFVAGKMFFVKFGSGQQDPVWPVDVFEPQREKAQTVLGGLLADAIEGFPVLMYPMCLQKAHESAALVDFDFDVIQDLVFDGVRGQLGSDAQVLEEFQLQDSDPASQRY